MKKEEKDSSVGGISLVILILGIIYHDAWAIGFGIVFLLIAFIADTCNEKDQIT